MSFLLESEIFALAKGVPVPQLTPKCRAYEPSARDWHRNTDEELDQQLELWYSAGEADSAQIDTSLLDHPPIQAVMADGENLNDRAATPVAPPNKSECDQYESPGGSKESPLSSHHSNEFDNPDFHTHSTHNNDFPASGSLPSSSPATMKQEFDATAVMTASISNDTQNAPAATNMFFGSHPMQRVYTEPTIHSSTHWQSDHLDDAPLSNIPHYSSNGGHQPAFATSERIWQDTRNPGIRSKSQTLNPGPTASSRQHFSPFLGSNLRHEIQVPRRDHPTCAAAQYEGAMLRQHHAMASSHGLQQTFGAGINTSPYNNMVAPKSMTNNAHFVNRQNIQHNNDHRFTVDPHINPLDGHNDFAPAPYSAVSSQAVLKSQPLNAPSSFRGNAYPDGPHFGGAVRTRAHRNQMAKEDDESPPPPNLYYPNIEAARQAERPRFKTNKDRDLTIPKDDLTKQKYVARMVRCMKSTRRCQDNPGMVSQWEKLKQDGARVEQAAWRLLDMVLQVHEEGIPMLPNKPSCNRYSNMGDRWDAICAGLTTQKTMCKHLLGSEFTAQLVNDPTTATQRVTNNRKVNASKKGYLDKGRRAVHDDVAGVTRRGSSASTQMRAEDSEYDDETYADTYGDSHLGGNPGSVGEMGIEDAEGSTDEDYVHAMTSFTAPNPGPAAGRRAKRQLEPEDSDEYGVPAKRLRRTPANNRSTAHPVAQKRHIKNPRVKKSRSKLQVIDDIMYDLEDKSNEALVFSRGSEDVREKFNAIHYPNGRPTSSSTV